MRTALATGAVIHGRAGAAAFQHEPDVLHVRLFGAVEARIAQGAELEHVSLDEARRAQPEVDRARAHYVQRLYNVSIDDPDLYDLHHRQHARAARDLRRPDHGRLSRTAARHVAPAPDRPDRC